jgi:hypothetical protein
MKRLLSVHVLMATAALLGAVGFIGFKVEVLLW